MSTTLIPQHSSKTNEHYTPIDIINRVHRTLGHISLDPASRVEANEVVKADKFFTIEDDGFTQDWIADTVFCNPPGGVMKAGNKSQSVQALWWKKMCDEFELKHFSHGIFLAFSLNILQTCQKVDTIYHVCDFPYCIPKSRISFWSKDKIQNSPTHSNMIILLTDSDSIISNFINQFSNIGYISHEHY